MATSDELLALINAGPSGGAAADTVGPAKPIGIPDTFQPYIPERGPVSADQAERSPGRGAAQPYYDGAEFGPRTLSPEARARIQSAMAQAGLIGKNDTFRVGVWDETSAKAYKKVLAYANQGGIMAEDALQELLDAPQMDGDGSVGGELQQEPGKVSSTTSAVSLEEQMQQAARSRLGRKLRSNEIAKFVSIYQGMETGFNSKANAMQDEAAVSGEDASIEEIPGIDAASSQFIDANYAQEEAEQSSYGYLEALKNLVGG